MLNVRYHVLAKLFSLFKTKQMEKIFYNHAELGRFVFDSEAREWETVDNRIYLAGLPGTEESPDDAAIEDVLLKLRDIDKYWSICEKILTDIARDYESITKDVTVKNLFFVAAISYYEDYWEICFETHESFKWMYIGLQLKGGEVVSNTIDT